MEKKLSAAELSLVLGISERTVLRLARAGELPFEYEGRRPVFRLETLYGRFKETEGAAA
jgi:excisionase family DNA binding protein